MHSHVPRLDIRFFYDGFDFPVTRQDCGVQCAPYNPTGKPFCCDICQAIPVAYHQEWEYLSTHTDLWHKWRGDECASDPLNPAEIRADTPEHLELIACKGPAFCQREYRASSCRQFPFFPYVTSNYRFIGLAYYREYASSCWVISNLDQVTMNFRQAFIGTYDEIFNLWPDEFESYAAASAEMRDFFADQRRRFPLLHRNGGDYDVSPNSGRLRRINLKQLSKFGPYFKKTDPE
ncbi:MAG TPA: hypothetical protein VF338_07870 [Leptolinea sp.]